RGRGGAPAAVPLTLLWYVPVRAALRARGVADVELADYAATLPVVFATWRAVRTVARGETGLDVWSRYVASLPDGTVAQAEGAADVAALALWWAGIGARQRRSSSGSQGGSTRSCSSSSGSATGGRPNNISWTKTPTANISSRGVAGSSSSQRPGPT